MSDTPKCNASFLSVDEAMKCESEDWDSVVPLCVAKEIERENEALRKDAERYRWLRVSKCNPAYPARSGQYGVSMIFGEHLDAVIDAAIAAEGK